MLTSTIMDSFHCTRFILYTPKWWHPENIMLKHLYQNPKVSYCKDITLNWSNDVIWLTSQEDTFSKLYNISKHYGIKIIIWYRVWFALDFKLIFQVYKDATWFNFMMLSFTSVAFQKYFISPRPQILLAQSFIFCLFCLLHHPQCTFWWVILSTD